jgi:catechol 2,3-dioxygenase-like lactoylglutathione lyase family enzyme
MPTVAGRSTQSLDGMPLIEATMKSRLQGIHPVLASNNLAASIRFYRGLGFTLLQQDEPEEPKYAVVERDGVQLHIQWADQEQWAYPVDRPACRFMVSDVDTIYREFVDSGIVSPETSEGSPWAAPAETPWGTREFHLRDPGRNSLQFYRPL